MARREVRVGMVREVGEVCVCVVCVRVAGGRKEVVGVLRDRRERESRRRRKRRGVIGRGKEGGLGEGVNGRVLVGGC